MRTILYGIGSTPEHVKVSDGFSGWCPATVTSLSLKLPEGYSEGATLPAILLIVLWKVPCESQVNVSCRPFRMLCPRTAIFPEHIFKSLWWSDVGFVVFRFPAVQMPGDVRLKTEGPDSTLPFFQITPFPGYL